MRIRITFIVMQKRMEGFKEDSGDEDIYGTQIEGC